MYLEEYVEYLKKEKNMSLNSIDAYKGDLLELKTFIEEREAKLLEKASSMDIIAYLMKLKGEGKSPATINRKLASARAFYSFLLEKKTIQENPANGIKSPKIKRKQLEYLNEREIETLLSLPIETDKEIRNMAILELMYATGLRAKEVIEANTKDVNTKIGFISCSGKYGKARVIPIGVKGRKAIEVYLEQVRGNLAKEGEEALFINFYGERMTRQGLWKILKECGKRAGLENPMTPNILRNSFAIHMLQHGADLKSIQELLGHEELASTQIYAGFVRVKLKDVYDNCHPRA